MFAVYEAAATFDASIVSDVFDFNTPVFSVRPVRPAVTGCTTTAPGIPPTHFGIGMAIIVPWDETNRRHHVVVRIENSDGRELIKVESDVEMGRPPGSQAGQDFRSVLAINANVEFPAAGTYRVVATTGESQKHVTFRVNNGPATIPPATSR